MDKFADRLLRITADCRSDMHEPDEQHIKVRIVGDHFDNAFREDIRKEAIEQGYQEFVVIIEREIYDHGQFVDKVTEKFNLATLIAYARVGAKNNPFLTNS